MSEQNVRGWNPSHLAYPQLKVSKSKAKLIDERQSALPLPEQPPVASDWNSADARTVNVGSGGVESDVSYGNGSDSGLRGPATAESGVRISGDEFGKSTGPSEDLGREGKDGLDKLPKDSLKKWRIVREIGFSLLERGVDWRLC